jgi:hypothetical protein
MTFGQTFAQPSVKGALTRGAVAWVLITPLIAAAKIWWSATAALVVFVVAVSVYIAIAARYTRRHSAHPTA